MSDHPLLVVIESPYAGEVELHTAYARRAMADSLKRGEAPIASHLIYTQPGILDDKDPEERCRGIDAGFAWGARADLVVFYVDHGWSEGMLAARAHWGASGLVVLERTIGPSIFGEGGG